MRCRAPDVSLIDRLWYGDGAADIAGRALLAPVTWILGAATASRNALYDAGVLRERRSALPALSVGNLSVGGTGKTPVSAWAAQQLRAAGARPAVVLRGYGGDEPLVHARLNPDVTVIADGDRVRGVELARVRGADCVILDDAFQHRRIARVADWVLVSAEQWRRQSRTLPSGPLREPVASLARADILLVTRKTASLGLAQEIADRLSGRLSGGASAAAVVHLAPDALVDTASTDRHQLSYLAGRSVVAVAAVGLPLEFVRQLEAAGARVTPVAYRDHHRFSAADVQRIVRLAKGRDGVVCTLKDAVKLAPLWAPATAPLWYVSQRAVVERGSAALAASLALVLTARSGVSPTAGSAGPSSPGHGHRSSTAD